MDPSLSLSDDKTFIYISFNLNKHYETLFPTDQLHTWTANMNALKWFDILSSPLYEYKFFDSESPK